MTERAKRCGNCGAWDALTLMKGAEVRGLCLRRAPLMAGAVCRNAWRENGMNPSDGWWPEVGEGDWCLDWLPREAGDGRG